MRAYLTLKTLVKSIKEGQSITLLLNDIYDKFLDGNIVFLDEVPFANTRHLIIPNKMIPFHEFHAHPVTDVCVHFFISDRQFATVRNNPMEYIPLLQKAQSVIAPDFSQYLSMPHRTRFINSFSNKILYELWKSEGIRTIPNATWSTPNSYKYSFIGIPTNSVIAINSNGILKSDMSKYFWREGYQAALTVLKPRLILRYGPKILGENTSISSYFSNERLNLLRNGR